MSMATRAALLMLFLSVCAQAQTRTLALYSGPARDLNVESTAAFQIELQRLFVPAGIHVVLKKMGERKTGEDFDLVAVTSLEGTCSVSEPSVSQASFSESTAGSLADTSISNGHVLPFFRVDCTRVVRMLIPTMDTLDLHARHALLGRALARVMAHEIYHIIAGTAEHQYSGVAKASFSARDLTGTRFEFDVSSITRLRPRQLSGTAQVTSPGTEARDLSGGADGR